MARHVAITQNNIFVVSLEYFQEVSDKVSFFLADKHESFLQIDSRIFYGVGHSFPKFPK